MANHMPKWGPVEKTMLEEVFEPEVLKTSVPQMGQVIEGAEMVRDMQNEIGILGKFRRVAGFDNTRGVQRIAKINTSIVMMLDQLHEASCTCSRPLWGQDGHKQWFLAWLSGPGAAFDLRTKTII